MLYKKSLTAAKLIYIHIGNLEVALSYIFLFRLLLVIFYITTFRKFLCTFRRLRRTVCLANVQYTYILAYIFVYFEFLKASHFCMYICMYFEFYARNRSYLPKFVYLFNQLFTSILSSPLWWELNNIPSYLKFMRVCKYLM